MAKKANSEKLAAAFDAHIDETEGQVERLEQIFEMIGKSARGKRCPAIDGLAEEASEIMSEAEDATVLDAGHTRGGSGRRALRDLALRHACRVGRQARHDGCRRAPACDPRREKATDLKLSDLALSEINVAADEGEASSTHRKASSKPKKRAA